MFTLLSDWLRTQRLNRAHAIPTHLTRVEKNKLFELASRECRVAVEIGSYLGASSCFIAEAIRSNPRASLTCVDTWQNDAMSEGKRDTYSEFIANTRAYRSLIVQKRGLSADVACQFNGKIDFLFIDADHEYEGVKKDWDAWAPFLSVGAIIAMHDVGWSTGVQRVINEDVKPVTVNHNSLPNLFWAQKKP